MKDNEETSAVDSPNQQEQESCASERSGMSEKLAMISSRHQPTRASRCSGTQDMQNRPRRTSRVQTIHLSSSSTDSRSSASRRRSRSSSLLEVKSEIAARNSTLLGREQDGLSESVDSDLFDGLEVTKSKLRGHDTCQEETHGCNGAFEIFFGDLNEEFSTDECVPVALSVEEDLYLPTALEFDPDAKPPTQTNPSIVSLYRRTALFIGGSFLLLGVSMLFLGLGFFLIPEHIVDESGVKASIEQFMVETTGGNKSLNQEKSYRMALDWICYDDPLNMSPGNPHLQQRFLLAYVYFASSVDDDWESPCRPDAGADIECNPDGEDNAISNRWLSSATECDWYGVRCDGLGQVASIGFKHKDFSVGMKGELPAGLGRFPFIQTLSLRNGELSGSLGSKISYSKHLVNLDLRDNHVGGTLSSGFVDWHHSLHRLNIAGNRIEGTLPETMPSALRDLMVLDLSENMLTGAIPHHVIEWRHVQDLILNNNMLSSAIPKEIALMNRLAHLSVQNNLLTGTIPTDVSRLSRLRTLNLGSNQLNGTIPSEIGLITLLESLKLERNSLSGVLPKLGGSPLFELDLSHNRLQGGIPPEILELPSLLILKVQDNVLSGTIPTVLEGRPSGFVHFDISSNDGLTGSVPNTFCRSWGTRTMVLLWRADCLADEAGETNVDCNCCNSCCGQMDSTCVEV